MHNLINYFVIHHITLYMMKLKNNSILTFLSVILKVLLAKFSNFCSVLGRAFPWWETRDYNMWSIQQNHLTCKRAMKEWFGCDVTSLANVVSLILTSGRERTPDGPALDFCFASPVFCNSIEKCMLIGCRVKGMRVKGMIVQEMTVKGMTVYFQKILEVKNIFFSKK